VGGVTDPVRHLRGRTYHGRKGAIGNSFRYGVDYVLLDAEADVPAPLLFGRNRAAPVSLHDRDHGGAPGAGRGVAWVRETMAGLGLPAPARVRLLAQPRVLGHVFNPVSFWLLSDAGGALAAVIAEVTNTYGDRHSYLCRHADGRPILPSDTLRARKLLHVSPFQPVRGHYSFRFDIREDRLGIWIDYETEDGGGLYTNLVGPLGPLTTPGLLGATLRRPFGSRRVLGLIHWQAARLAAKGARFRSRPRPPVRDISS
jgi:uncharacterized protein